MPRYRANATREQDADDGDDDHQLDERESPDVAARRVAARARFCGTPARLRESERSNRPVTIETIRPGATARGRYSNRITCGRHEGARRDRARSPARLRARSPINRRAPGRIVRVAQDDVTLGRERGGHDDLVRAVVDERTASARPGRTAPPAAAPRRRRARCRAASGRRADYGSTGSASTPAAWVMNARAAAGSQSVTTMYQCGTSR